MTMKRSLSEMESDHHRTNGLELLSAATTGRVFTCKTCDREFPSFQALGGHRASHKKLPKLLPSSSSAETSSTTTISDERPASPPKPKTHECSICGLEFAIGQALGGHMRRHRQQIADAVAKEQRGRDHAAVVPAVPVLKKSISSKRICLELDLDLHLGPPGSYNISRDNLKLQLMTPLY